MNRRACLFAILLCVPVTVVNAEPTKKAEDRAKILKENLDTFQLMLLYDGQQDKPFYNLTLSVKPVRQAATNQFHPVVQIDKDQAKRIIEHLAKDGFLDQATDPRVEKKRPPTTTGYSLTVNGQDLEWQAGLGWDLAMVRRLDNLHSILDGKAEESIKILISRLSGYRQEWEKADSK